MRYSLLEHPNTYYPATDTETPGRWYSGDVFAARHLEMAKQFPHKAKGHCFIAKIESMPVLGWIAAVLEEIAIELFANWIDHRKMRSNLEEAFTQHTGPEIARWNEIDHTPAKNIRIELSQAEDKGKKKTMEDKVTVTKDNTVGVFDGHCGAQVAQYLTTCNWTSSNTLHRVDFRRNFSIRQERIASEKTWDTEGSTATVINIDKSTGYARVATVGDSYAFLYRVIGGQVKAIPLSPVRNWKHPKEMARAQTFDPEFKPNETDPKPRFNGYEVSRSIGDAGANDDGRLFTSHMPKVTECALQINDIIVVASDGLWDAKSHSQIISAINPRSETIARDILNSIENKARQDNIAIVAMRILPHTL